jgi:hypothetical protein
VLVQPPGQRRGRRPDHGPVHPVRPGSHLAAQPRRAELQAAGEPVGELVQGLLRPLALLLAGGEQALQLGPVARIRVLADPGLHVGAQAGGNHGSFPAAGRCSPAGQAWQVRQGGQIRRAGQAG